MLLSHIPMNLSHNQMNLSHKQMNLSHNQMSLSNALSQKAGTAFHRFRCKRMLRLWLKTWYMVRFMVSHQKQSKIETTGNDQAH